MEVSNTKYKKVDTKNLSTQRGITLVISLIMLTIVLSVSIGLSVVTLKQLTVSTVTRESVEASYASESGVECVRFWSSRNRDFFTFPADDPLDTISCLGSVIDLNDVHSVDEDGNDVFALTFTSVNGRTTNVDVVRIDDSSTLLVRSEGYNADFTNPNTILVQRLNEYEIQLPEEISDTDIVLLIDTSGSICRVPGDSQYCPELSSEDESEFDTMISGIADFVRSFEESSTNDFINNVRFGALGFSTNAHSILAPTTTVSVVSDHISSDIGSAGFGFTNIIDGLVKTIPSFNLTDERPDIVIFVTDGRPTHQLDPPDQTYPNYNSYVQTDANDETNYAQSLNTADLMEADGVEISVVGIGDDLREDFLQELVTEEGLYVRINNFDEITDALIEISSGFVVTPIEIN